MENIMTKKEKFALIERLIQETSVAGLLCSIAAICTVKSYNAIQTEDMLSAESWQETAERILETSYKVGC